MGHLVLIRHGQATFHDDDYDKLSPLGEEQARLVGAYWAHHGVQFDCIVSGPLARQRRSAELAGQAYVECGGTWPSLTIIDTLSEMPVEALSKRFMPRLCMEEPAVLDLMQRFGESTDRAERERIFQKAFERLLILWAQCTYQHPEIETFQEFTNRVRSAYESLMGSGQNGQRIAVFTSGGPTAVAMHMALQTSFETTLELVWQVRNAAFTEFMFTQGRFTLNSFNTIPHLTEPRLWTYR